MTWRHFTDGYGHFACHPSNIPAFLLRSPEWEETTVGDDGLCDWCRTHRCSVDWAVLPDEAEDWSLPGVAYWEAGHEA